jgi:hypothetical protein
MHTNQNTAAPQWCGGLRPRAECTEEEEQDDEERMMTTRGEEEIIL